MKTRRLTFANSAVDIEYSGNRPTQIIEFLYRYLPPVENSTEAHIVYRLTEDKTSDELVLSHTADGGDVRSPSEGYMAEYLLGQSCFRLVDKSKGGLLFHGGGLQFKDKGLILPGQSGAGKSTLTAWLLTQGFQYLTDEIIFVPEATSTFQAFTRPLNLKRTARPVIKTLFDYEGTRDRILNSGTVDLIPPEFLSPHPPTSKALLSLIVFPNFQIESNIELRKLSKAQTGLELMKCLVNARNLSQHGFSEVTRLANSVPAYRLTYSNFVQINGAVERLLAATR